MSYKPERALTQVDDSRQFKFRGSGVEMSYKPERALTHSR